MLENFSKNFTPSPDLNGFFKDKSVVEREILNRKSKDAAEAGGLKSQSSGSARREPNEECKSMLIALPEEEKLSSQPQDNAQASELNLQDCTYSPI